MAIFELPQNPTDSTAVSAETLARKITDELSILFIVIGSAKNAIKLRDLAEQQTNTGGAWVREVVWVKDPQILAEPVLTPFINGVVATDVGFTIGFLDKPARIVKETAIISTGTVFLGYVYAEAQQ